MNDFLHHVDFFLLFLDRVFILTEKKKSNVDPIQLL